MKQIQDKLIKLSKAIGEKLERDQGNLSLLVFGSVATGCIINRPDLDLLLITKKGPTEKEPKNIQEEIIQGTKVQITRITPEQLKKDVNSFLDYRINQVQKGLIVFDREGLFQKYQELFRKGFEPNKKTLQRWIRDLKEDEETIMYPPREDPYLVFSCNRLALWSFRTFLILKQDFFKGPKYLENHIHRHPEISDFFCKAFASESIDLDKRVHLKNNIPSLEKDIYLTMVNDLLSDSQELEHHGRILDSKACFVDRKSVV